MSILRNASIGISKSCVLNLQHVVQFLDSVLTSYLSKISNSIFSKLPKLAEKAPCTDYLTETRTFVSRTTRLAYKVPNFIIIIHRHLKHRLLFNPPGQSSYFLKNRNTKRLCCCFWRGKYTFTQVVCVSSE